MIIKYPYCKCTQKQRDFLKSIDLWGTYDDWVMFYKWDDEVISHTTSPKVFPYQFSATPDTSTKDFDTFLTLLLINKEAAYAVISEVTSFK